MIPETVRCMVLPINVHKIVAEYGELNILFEVPETWIKRWSTVAVPHVVIGVPQARKRTPALGISNPKSVR